MAYRSQLPVTYHVTEKLTSVWTLEHWSGGWRPIEECLTRWKLGNDSRKLSVLDNCTIAGPVSIDQGCMLKDCIIGPYVSIGAGSHIEDCRMENSIILSGVHLKHISYPLKDTIIGYRSVMAGLQSRDGRRDQ